MGVEGVSRCLLNIAQSGGGKGGGNVGDRAAGAADDVVVRGRAGVVAGHVLEAHLDEVAALDQSMKRSIHSRQRQLGIVPAYTGEDVLRRGVAGQDADGLKHRFSLDRISCSSHPLLLYRDVDILDVDIVRAGRVAVT